MTVKQLKRWLAKERRMVRDIDIDDLDLIVYDETDREHARFLEIDEAELDVIFEKWPSEEESWEVIALTATREHKLESEISQQKKKEEGT
jgi:hypothetical protein